MKEFDGKDFSCKDRKIPFVLLNRHSSRTDFDFLHYINNDRHKSVVCIGFPYRIAL